MISKEDRAGPEVAKEIIDKTSETITLIKTRLTVALDSLS